MKAIIIPADLTKPVREVEGETYRKICQEHTDIYWVERVSTPILNQLGLAIAVDDEGHDKNRAPNIRAVMISGYAGEYGLAGDAVLFGETSPPEITFCDVPENTLFHLNLEYLQQEAEQVNEMLKKARPRA